MIHRRSAFTLFQLLILLALLMVLFALLLPAVAKVRLAAARAQSANNLKQILLALHNYNDVHNVLPAGNDGNNFSVAVHILPYIEQDNLYKSIDLKKSVDDPANAAVRKTIVRTFLNPQDSVRMVTPDYGPTNYLFSAGTNADLVNNNGAFYQNSRSRIPTSFPDGLSNTIFVGDTLKGDGGVRAMDVRRQHVRLKKEALKGIKDEAGVQEFQDSKHIAANRCASWMDGRFLQGTFNGRRAINDAKPDVDCGGLGGLSALRNMQDGVSVGLGDGSVRFVSSSVSLTTWRAAITRDGGEVLGADW
jgi:hypothetical protein